ncbi:MULTISPECIES: hypothetical protein [Alphaproteobacteria]|jgi:MYXO-CTERM domain-containing protein|uniref:PEP-CTERM sorting domain-containing protein n=1 Tax=Parvularcula marina TaxID=2292771 RepID=A0A371RKN8_9PROT|nr:hypothetical protein [Parvularcula marina]RFB06004.1 hypothetical protein DX908_12470 [Parvularcula marina]
MKRVLSILIAAGMALFATAQAGTVYNYTITDSNQKADVGQLEYLSVSYDTDEKISFKAKLGKSPAGVAANGGWFVLSPGANPKGIGNELAIFYMDFEGGDLYVYKYDGRSGSSSFGPNSFKRYGSYITTYYDVLNVTGDADGLTIEINNLSITELAPGTFGPNWTGASFGEKFGAWIHFTALDEFRTRRGKIKAYDPGLQSWYDIANRNTTEVSEPIGFAAAGLLLAGGLVGWRRRQQRVAAA